MPYGDLEVQRRYQREFMARRRKEWIDRHGPCARCGSDDRLEVDHVDRATKTMNPGSIWSRRKQIRDAELAKCQVLCHACHAEKTMYEATRRDTCRSGHRYSEVGVRTQVGKNGIVRRKCAECSRIRARERLVAQRVA